MLNLIIRLWPDVSALFFPFKAFQDQRVLRCHDGFGIKTPQPSFNTTQTTPLLFTHLSGPVCPARLELLALGWFLLNYRFNESKAVTVSTELLSHLLLA